MRATTEPAPSAPTVKRARRSRGAPSPGRTTTPAQRPSARMMSSTRARSSVAPAATAASRTIASRSSRAHASAGPENDKTTGGAPGATRRTPRSGVARPRTASRRPSRSSVPTAPPLRYSPHTLRRGKRARSTIRTSIPARARSSAVALPAGPPPEMTTSFITSRARRPDCRRSRSSGRTARGAPAAAASPPRARARGPRPACRRAAPRAARRDA